MKNTNSLLYGIILLAGSLILWGCPKKTDMAASPETQKGELASSQKSGDVNTGRITGISGETSKPSEEGSTLTSASLQPIFFDYDKSYLRTDALKTIANNVALLKADPRLTVRDRREL